MPRKSTPEELKGRIQTFRTLIATMATSMPEGEEKSRILTFSALMEENSKKFDWCEDCGNVWISDSHTCDLNTSDESYSIMDVLMPNTLPGEN